MNILSFIFKFKNEQLVKNFILKSLSQKGDPVETFKLLSLKQGVKGVDGQVSVSSGKSVCTNISMRVMVLDIII